MRDLFEIPPDISYFNCAYLGPQLKTVTAAGHAALARKAAPWDFDMLVTLDEAEKLRRLLAKIIGGDADGVALVPSASYGLQIAANNLPLEPGSEIVVLAEQFPSNVYPWMALVRKSGAVLRTVPRPASGTWTAGVLAAINARTAIVATPHCHWTDGTAVDLAEVGKKAREVGAALVVDASQSLGAWPLDLASVQPDYVVSVGYKWLLGPVGLGYLYVAPQRRFGVPLEYNWLTRKGSEVFSRLVVYEDDFQPGARRYDMGERNNFVSVPMAIAALEQIDRWGVPSIAAELAKKNALIEEGARKLGFDPIPADARAPHLMGIRFRGSDPLALAEKLRARKVFASVRGTAVRIAPHLYNTDRDIENLLAALSN